MGDKIRWYNSDRVIVETIIGKNGKERPVTVRDARSLGLFPSVTSILSQVAKPALTRYFINRAIACAYNNKDLLNGSEKEAQWKVSKLAEETGNGAAEFGTKIHDHIERFLKAKADESVEIKGDVRSFVEPVFEFFLKHNIQGKSEEAVIIETEGRKAAGTIDLQTTKTVTDFKTQKTKDGKFKKYDSWVWQLGGYNLHAKKDNAVIIAISSTEPGLIKTFKIDEASLREGERVFKLLLELFYITKGL